MNNLYHKFAVASVGIALGFTLGANKEAKAASFNFAPTIIFHVVDGLNDAYDGRGDELFPGSFNHVLKAGGPRHGGVEKAPFAEFSIGNFSVGPHTFINSAIFQAEISSFQFSEGVRLRSLVIFCYVGNGTAEVSDFEAGVFLNSVVNVSSSSPGDILNFDVTPFVNQRVSNGDTFAGFGIRALNLGGLALERGQFSGIQPRLIIETADVAEPVPEPTTIFGSAIALGLGGWLKRKNSSQQNKTKSQG